MARVEWSDRATHQLSEIARFIARNSPGAARAVVQRLVRSADRLEAFPFSGRIVPEFRETNVRELIVGNYCLIYQVQGNAVTILMIQHGAQSLLPVEQE